MQGSYEKLHKKFKSNRHRPVAIWFLVVASFFVVANRPNTNLHIFLIQFL